MEELSISRCALCKEVFLGSFGTDQIEEFQEYKKTNPDVEPIMLCIECCYKLEARMPHKAYLN